MTPLIKGGQGRTSHDLVEILEGFAYAIAFVAIAGLIYAWLF